MVPHAVVISAAAVTAVAVEAPHTAAVEPAAGPHASGYTHPAIGTAARLVSAGSAQPSPPVVVAAVNVDGVGRVGIALVAVYIGSWLGSSPLTLESAGGGYCEKDASAVAAMVPAPEPPVCHD